MSNYLMKCLNQLKALVLCGAAAVFIQAFSALRNGTLADFHLFDAIIGMVIMIVICLAALKIKEVIPIKIPAFAWASLLALLVSAPFCPFQAFILKYNNAIAFSSVSTLIMAVAGISLGSRLNELMKLSWKMVLVAIVVFCGTFFGSALISQIILTIQGII